MLPTGAPSRGDGAVRSVDVQELDGSRSTAGPSKADNVFGRHSSSNGYLVADYYNEAGIKTGNAHVRQSDVEFLVALVNECKNECQLQERRRERGKSNAFG
ncbi:unnamed protein product [Lampetra fluviatilis]